MTSLILDRFKTVFLDVITLDFLMFRVGDTCCKNKDSGFHTDIDKGLRRQTHNGFKGMVLE